MDGVHLVDIAIWREPKFNVPKPVRQSGFRPKPRWGAYSAPLDPLAGREGVRCSLPKNHPALGPKIILVPARTWVNAAMGVHVQVACVTLTLPCCGYNAHRTCCSANLPLKPILRFDYDTTTTKK